METAVAELPLALFTTLAPFGAGAFVLIAISLFVTQFEETELARLDKLTLIPLGIVCVGFLISVFHLAAPLNAFGVFAGLGSSPLSNEILCGIVFVVVAAIYCVLAWMGKLTKDTRKIFASIVALLAVVFSLFVGMAYMMSTIASWNTVLVPIQILGLMLLGGASLGSALVLTSCNNRASLKSVMVCSFTVALIGFVMAFVAIVGHYEFIQGLFNPFMEGSTLVGDVMGLFTSFVVCALVSLIILALSVRNPSFGMVVIAAGFGLIAIFLARFSFYALQLSVGL